jgi:hypothetical protein
MHWIYYVPRVLFLTTHPISKFENKWNTRQSDKCEYDWNNEGNRGGCDDVLTIPLLASPQLAREGDDCEQSQKGHEL